MKIRFPNTPVGWAWGLGLLGAITLGVTWGSWYPATNAWIDHTLSVFRGSQASHAAAVPGAGDQHTEHDGHDHDHDHDAHDHDAHGHDAHGAHRDVASLELSPQAMRNIGLSEETIQPVKLETFRRAITVPAVVAERPGRTRVQVATPMTGVITHVHAVQGEAVEPGTLLFQIRLTHEDLVNAQKEFVKTLGEREVEEREIARLQNVTRSGAIAGKFLLEREYARDKLTALLEAQREALKLHGLSDAQVEQIATERRLLRELQVFAPSADDHSHHELKLTQSLLNRVRLTHPVSLGTVEPVHEGPLILQELDVHKGQSVEAGETLCVLSDYSELFIEGMAFEQDVSQLRQASENEWTVDAIFQRPGAGNDVVEGLEIAYLAQTIDADSRTLRFYVHLPNEVTKDRREQGNRYVEWRYLPGQRLQLQVPVEQWPQQIVLPVDAIAREGAESFVFQKDDDHFDRVPVHVKYRDRYSAVIENDGSLSPGDLVALRGAHQMQMALKNASGGGVDPHAGHQH